MHRQDIDGCRHRGLGELGPSAREEAVAAAVGRSPRPSHRRGPDGAVRSGSGCTAASTSRAGADGRPVGDRHRLVRHLRQASRRTSCSAASSAISCRCSPPPAQPHGPALIDDVQDWSPRAGRPIRLFPSMPLGGPAGGSDAVQGGAAIFGPGGRACRGPGLLRAPRGPRRDRRADSPGCVRPSAPDHAGDGSISSLDRGGSELLPADAPPATLDFLEEPIRARAPTPTRNSGPSWSTSRWRSARSSTANGRSWRFILSAG